MRSKKGKSATYSMLMLNKGGLMGVKNRLGSMWISPYEYVHIYNKCLRPVRLEFFALTTCQVRVTVHQAIFVSANILFGKCKSLVNVIALCACLLL